MSIVRYSIKKLSCIILSITILFLTLSCCAKEKIDIKEDTSPYTTIIESDNTETSNEELSTVETTAVSTTFPESIKASTTVQSESELPTKNHAEKNISYGILFDVNNNKVLFSKNADKKVYPASLTKLVTACTALQYVPIDIVFTVGSEQSLVKPESSLCLIKRGHKLTLYDLLCGMLISSGNDAAYTIAVNTARYIYKDQILNDDQAVKIFCHLMNDFAQSIGMTNSHFTNPDGWDNTEQYTTVNDLLKLALYSNKNSTLCSITSCEKKHVVFESGQNITWTNTNKLLDKSSKYYYPYAVGMKTGTTSNAGKSLIASASKDGKAAIAIIMKCETEEQRYTSAIQLLDKVLKS